MLITLDRFQVAFFHSERLLKASNVHNIELKKIFDGNPSYTPFPESDAFDDVPSLIVESEDGKHRLVSNRLRTDYFISEPAIIYSNDSSLENFFVSTLENIKKIDLSLKELNVKYKRIGIIFTFGFSPEEEVFDTSKEITSGMKNLVDGEFRSASTRIIKDLDWKELKLNNLVHINADTDSNKLIVERDINTNPSFNYSEQLTSDVIKELFLETRKKLSIEQIKNFLE